MPRLKMPGEFEHIAWIRNQQRSLPPAVLLGPGDDCAVVRASNGSQLITTDMLMGGVDFLLEKVDPRRVGRKAMAVNLSDIAAMAGVPRTALASVALPKGPGAESLAKELFRGLKEMADEFAVAIVGGDTNTWTSPLAISVTLLGDVTDRGYITRAGAQPGDWLFITGPLGGSLRGHHLDFTPRVNEALALHAQVQLKAMIDISDGLAADLRHILDESGCGAVLDAAAIPIRRGCSLTNALGDGEDFELLLAVSPADGAKLLPRRDLWKIGECIDVGMWIVDNNQRRELPPTGWKHEFKT